MDIDQKIIDILERCTVDDDELNIQDYLAVNLDIVSYLIDKECVSEILNNKGDVIYKDDIKIGDHISLKLSPYKLSVLGYYISFEAFILNNKLHVPAEFYIKEFDFLSTSSNSPKPFSIQKYEAIIKLIEALESISEVSSNVIDIKNLFIVNKDTNMLVVAIDYVSKDIEQCDIDFSIIEDLCDTFTNHNNEKKMLFVNELINFLMPVEETLRFEFLISNIRIYYSHCLQSYEYYIRNFSFNKFKLELDNATLDYSRKIQSVINDAQSKLIAIPAAFVLACATIDFTNINSLKNILLIGSLYVFSLLIDIFIRNQHSALKMIQCDIKSYQDTFMSGNTLNEEASISFRRVNKELKHQKGRLLLIRIIAWAIPIFFSFVLLFFINIKTLLITILASFINV
ncbi:MAG: hypothetical protein Q8861_02420 [Bacteroidota bacterium]|nr:hypothetical protein [Bacteroidota bacterium]